MVDSTLRRQVGLLGRFIGVREPNLKYLGLENMVRLAEVPAVMETVSKCAAMLSQPNVQAGCTGSRWTSVEGVWHTI